MRLLLVRLSLLGLAFLSMGVTPSERTSGLVCKAGLARIVVSDYGLILSTGQLLHQHVVQYCEGMQRPIFSVPFDAGMPLDSVTLDASGHTYVSTSAGYPNWKSPTYVLDRAGRIESTLSNTENRSRIGLDPISESVYVASPHHSGGDWLDGLVRIVAGTPPHVIATFPAAMSGRGIALDSHHHLFISQPQSRIGVIDIPSGVQIGTIQTKDKADIADIAIGHDGMLYATLYDGSTDEFDPDSLRLLRTMQTTVNRNPGSVVLVAASRDGTVYVADQDAGVIEVYQRSFVIPIAMPVPGLVAMALDGRGMLYALCHRLSNDGPAVHVFDGGTLREVQRYSVGLVAPIAIAVSDR